MALALAFMTIITFIQVILRYVFGTGLVWSLEATTYAFAWLVLIGMSYGVRTRAHIAVDLFSNRLPFGVRRAMAIIVSGLCLLYCGFMVYGGTMFIDGLFSLGNNARDIPLPRWLLTRNHAHCFFVTGVPISASHAPYAGPRGQRSNLKESPRLRGHRTRAKN